MVKKTKRKLRQKGSARSLEAIPEHGEDKGTPWLTNAGPLDLIESSAG